MRESRGRRRWWAGLVTALITVGGAVALFETLYRVQLIDTYAPELRAYNLPKDLGESGGDRPTALLIGDSFTAGADGSYPADLRRDLPGARIVNAGISGTGVVQAAIVAKERFARFHPKVFVYQIYVGNDLFDIRYPVNWERASVLRNVYWLVTTHLRSLAFVNYRLGQLRYQELPSSVRQAAAKAPDQPFSVARYDSRVKTYFRVEPRLLESSILVQHERAGDFAELTARLHRLMARCVPGHCSAYVLVIPHCAQVSAVCLQQNRALGAELDDSLAVEAPDYPFVARVTASLRDLANVTVLNPLDTLRATVRNGQAVYHANDEHLNATGNRVIAAYLAPFLARALGVPEAPAGS
jgi:hypothetical protein